MNEQPELSEQQIAYWRRQWDALRDDPKVRRRIDAFLTRAQKASEGRSAHLQRTLVERVFEDAT